MGNIALKVHTTSSLWDALRNIASRRFGGPENRAKKQNVFLDPLANKILTANNLTNLDWPHNYICQLCDQEDETVQHLLTNYVFAREIWLRILSKVGLASLTPDQEDTMFTDWWHKAHRQVEKQH